jgi:hypothetical protein
MTMHLSRHSMLRTKRPTIKRTKANLAKWAEGWKQHNKRMKQYQIHDMVMDFETYIKYLHGLLPKPKVSFSTRTAPVEIRHSTKHIPSLNSADQWAPALRKEQNQYTGDNLLGIGTMHKSNMVPIFKSDADYAKDIAKMRR